MIEKEYIVIDSTPGQLQGSLSIWASKGWRLHTPLHSVGMLGIPTIQLIFERDKPASYEYGERF